PWTVFVSFTNAARVRQRMRQVVYATVALVGLVLAIGVPLMGPLGVDGLGVGWLAGQSQTAVGILAVRRAGDRAPMLLRTGRRARTLLPVGSHERMLVLPGGRLRMLVRPRLHGVLSDVLAELGRTGDRWTLQREIPTRNDVAVGIIGRVGRGPAAVIKYARGPATLRSLRPNASALQSLARAPWLPAEWRALVPRVIAAGPLGRGAYVAETCLPGRTMEALLRDGAEPGALLDASATAIDRLHTATGRSDRFDEALMAELVEAPLQRLCTVLAHRPGRASRKALAHLRTELCALAGTKLTSAWTHGDLSPGNILIGGPDTAVTGIVDWEAGTTRGLPQLDLLQLLISTRTAIEGRELGSVVVELRRDGAWHPHEQQAVRKLDLGAGSPSTRTLVLLAWLAHVSANLRKSTRYAHNPLWLRRNVDPVLHSLLPEPASATAWPAGLIARGRARVAARPETAIPLVALGVAVALWGVSLPQIDPRAMTNMGLISVLPPAFPAALALLTFGFMVEAHRGARRRWVLVCHVFALVLFIHGTPEIVYGTLRYTWAYKHVGIVDYILRHGGVDPTIAPRFLNVYHDWPGFFALMALLAQLGGLHTVLGLAGWGPVFNNLMYLGALLFVFSAVTDDRRVIWVSCWLFYIADWVGQDYFSPQGFAFLLYLLLIGIVLRWLRPGSRTTPGGRAGALWLAAGLIAAIVVTHALTAVMVCIALAALVLARACAARRLLPIAAAMTVGWDLTLAWPYAGPNLAATLSTVHLPWETTSSNLANLSALSADQAFVANVSRLLTVTVIALAVAGGVRLLRSHRLDRAVAVLAIAPIALFAAGNYDGEMLFRIYLFSLPFLALLGAQALAGITVRARTSLTAVAALVLLAPFLVTYYGNERANYVTPQEVTAARWVDTHVPNGSQVVTATGCDVLDTEYYEHFTCVPFGLQPRSSVSRMLADPVAGLSNWMADPAYRSSYLFLSRSQRVSVQENGGLPRGSLNAVQRKLVASPRFRVVYRNRDAIILTLASKQPRPPSAAEILRAQAR
ncbi:MAG: phosphotransferase family protein, partial [Solirubrobacteraceae bacterium]